MKEILIVDDDVDIAESLQLLLEVLGYKVSLAFDGHEGLRKIEEHPPDLIVTDIMLPEMTGPEMLERLPHHNGHPRPPVIMMSATPGADVAARFGASYISKPFDIKEIRRLIKELLGD